MPDLRGPKLQLPLLLWSPSRANSLYQNQKWDGGGRDGLPMGVVLEELRESLGKREGAGGEMEEGENGSGAHLLVLLLAADQSGWRALA